jgi:hypothetical protein
MQREDNLIRADGLVLWPRRVGNLIDHSNGIRNKSGLLKKSLLTVAATFVLLSGSARGQANLTFSGGNGSPLSLTLNQPVVYTITTGFSVGPFFIFQNVGNPFNGAGGTVLGTISFTINGGASQVIYTINSGVNVGVVTANDLYIFGSEPGANAGDIIFLSAGTLTTTGNVAAPPPANGSYTTFITDGSGNLVSTNGIAVPEPQSAALLVTAGGLGFLFLMRQPRRSR